MARLLNFAKERAAAQENCAKLNVKTPAVMHEGALTGTLERAECTEENIMRLAVGQPLAAGV